MKWINCADNCPEVIHEDIIIRNVETKSIIENGYFRSYANKSDKWALNNFEWLDESEPSFSIEDMSKSFHEGANLASIEVGFYGILFNKFLKKRFNIDLTK